MARKGREFNEIYDLTAMRVIVERDGEEGTRDCYGALGLIHSLWKPMPGRFKDYIAMPKFNGYRSLHTTVIGPEGRPLEIQVRTREMHETAELGVAAHWAYVRDGRRSKRADEEWNAWVRQLMDINADESDAREFVKSFRTDLFDEEVFVFTPKGEVKTLPAGATPIDFAYAVHTDVGHRTVGAKVNGRIVPLHYRLRSGDRVEILTGKSAARGPSRDWLSLVASSRARNKIRQFFSREQKEDLEAKGRELLENALKGQNLPYKKLAGSAVLAGVIRESGYKKAEDFYIALGSGKLTASKIVDKVLQQLKVGEVAEEQVPVKKPRAREAAGSDSYGINVIGVEDVLVRLAKCCTPVPGDDIVGYISLGKGITIHRGDCPNVRALRRNPERFTPVEWEGGGSQSFRVQIAVDSWDRPRLLEDVARTFAEHGSNIVSYGGTVEDQMARNWYVGRGRRRQGAPRPAHGAPQRRRRLRRPSRDTVLGASLVRGIQAHQPWVTPFEGDASAGAARVHSNEGRDRQLCHTSPPVSQPTRQRSAISAAIALELGRLDVAVRPRARRRACRARATGTAVRRSGSGVARLGPEHELVALDEEDPGPGAVVPRRRAPAPSARSCSSASASTLLNGRSR